MKKGELDHDMRDRVRSWRWKQTEGRRESLTGIGKGVDCEKTNALWQTPKTFPKVAHAIRIIIAGGINTMEHVAKMKGGSNSCTHCKEGKTDTEHHLNRNALD